MATIRRWIAGRTGLRRSCFRTQPARHHPWSPTDARLQLFDSRVNQLPIAGLQPRQRADLILPHEPVIANDIGRPRSRCSTRILASSSRSTSPSGTCPLAPCGTRRCSGWCNFRGSAHVDADAGSRALRPLHRRRGRRPQEPPSTLFRHAPVNHWYLDRGCRSRRLRAATGAVCAGRLDPFSPDRF